MSGLGRSLLDVPSDLPSGMESFLADVVEERCGPYWDRIWEDARAGGYLKQLPPSTFIAMVDRFNVLWNCPGKPATLHDFVYGSIEFKNDISIDFNSMKFFNMLEFFEHIVTFKEDFTPITHIKLACFLHQFCYKKGMTVADGRADNYYRLFTDGLETVDLEQILRDSGRENFVDYPTVSADIKQSVSHVLECLYARVADRHPPGERLLLQLYTRASQHKEGNDDVQIVVDANVLSRVWIEKDEEGDVVWPKLMAFTVAQQGASGKKASLKSIVKDEDVVDKFVPLMKSAEGGEQLLDDGGWYRKYPVHQPVIIEKQLPIISSPAQKECLVRIFGIVSSKKVVVDRNEDAVQEGSSSGKIRRRMPREIASLRYGGISKSDFVECCTAAFGDAAVEAYCEKPSPAASGDKRKYYLNVEQTGIWVHVLYHRVLPDDSGDGYMKLVTPLKPGMLVFFTNDWGNSEQIMKWDGRNDIDAFAPSCATFETVNGARQWKNGTLVRISWLGFAAETDIQLQLGVQPRMKYNGSSHTKPSSSKDSGKDPKSEGKQKQRREASDCEYAIIYRPQDGDEPKLVAGGHLWMVDLLRLSIREDDCVRRRVYLPVQHLSVIAKSDLQNFYAWPETFYKEGDVVEFKYHGNQYNGIVCNLRGEDPKQEIHVARVVVEKDDGNTYYICPQAKLSRHVCNPKTCKHFAQWANLSRLHYSELASLTLTVQSKEGEAHMRLDDPGVYAKILEEKEVQLVVNGDVDEQYDIFYPLPGEMLLNRPIGLSFINTDKIQFCATITHFERTVEGDLYTAQTSASSGKVRLLKGLLGPLHPNTMTFDDGRKDAREWQVHLQVGAFVGCRKRRDHDATRSFNLQTELNDLREQLKDSEKQKVELGKSVKDALDIGDPENDADQFSQRLGEQEDFVDETKARIKEIELDLKRCRNSCKNSPWRCVFRGHLTHNYVPPIPQGVPQHTALMREDMEELGVSLPELHKNLLVLVKKFISHNMPKLNVGNEEQKKKPVKKFVRIGGMKNGRCPKCSSNHSRCVWYCPSHVNCVDEKKFCGKYWCTLSGFRHLADSQREPDVEVEMEASVHGQLLLSDPSKKWTDQQFDEHKQKYCDSELFENILGTESQKLYRMTKASGYVGPKKRKAPVNDGAQGTSKRASSGQNTDSVNASGGAGAPDPRAGAPDPRAGAPDPRAGAPDPRAGAPDPRAGAPDSRCSYSPSPAAMSYPQVLDTSKLPNFLKQNKWVGYLKGDLVVARDTGLMYVVDRPPGVRMCGSKSVVVNLTLLWGDEKMELPDTEVELVPPEAWFVQQSMIYDGQIDIANELVVKLVMERYWLRYCEWHDFVQRDSQDGGVFFNDPDSLIKSHLGDDAPSSGRG